MSVVKIEQLHKTYKSGSLEVEALCGDVLAHLSGSNLESGGLELTVQLDVDEVHLSQVGLARVPGDPGPVLHGLAKILPFSCFSL